VTGPGAAAAVERPAAVVVRLTAVTKAFGAGPLAQRVLDGVDLTLAAHEIVAVRGPSGSGKTTLLGLVLGWEQPDTGTVVVLGGARAPGHHRWDEVAVLPQTGGLLDELTLRENVTLPLRLGGRSDGDADALLARLGLDRLADRYPREVSLGEQQRAALARAAVVRPRVLLADEPVAHQDRARAAVVVGLLRDLADDGTACLVATHDEVTVAAAHAVLHLRDGRLTTRSG
jgi:putative ABC transport system ATP-binding protein